MHNCYSNRAYIHGYCSMCIYYFIRLFSLLSLLSLSFSPYSLLVSALTSPHLTVLLSLPSSLVGTEPNSSLLAVKVVVLMLEFSWSKTKLLSFTSSSSFTNPCSLGKSSSSSTKKSSQEQRQTN